MKLIEVVCDAGYAPTVAGIATQHEAVDFWQAGAGEDGRQVTRFLVADERSQTILDALQQVLHGSATARIVIVPLDATLPQAAEAKPAAEGEQAPSAGITREELYADIEKGARLDRNYILLVALSTVVAAIGLIEDNVAIVIGAMVIAPLLGPNLAFALAAALGDSALLARAARTGAVGLALALLLAYAVGGLWTVDLASTELMARTRVGLDSVALALASGAAAVLSLTAAVPTALVGVMVAVALLPPTATLGLMLGAGHWSLAIGAGLLLAVNVVSVNLAAKLVFLAKGITPRTWREKQKARQALGWYIALWLASLAVLVAAIVLWRRIAP